MDLDRLGRYLLSADAQCFRVESAVCQPLDTILVVDLPVGFVVERPSGAPLLRLWDAWSRLAASMVRVRAKSSIGLVDRNRVRQRPSLSSERRCTVCVHNASRPSSLSELCSPTPSPDLAGEGENAPNVFRGACSRAPLRCGVCSATDHWWTGRRPHRRQDAAGVGPGHTVGPMGRDPRPGRKPLPVPSSSPTQCSHATAALTTTPAQPARATPLPPRQPRHERVD